MEFPNFNELKDLGGIAAIAFIGLLLFRELLVLVRLVKNEGASSSMVNIMAEIRDLSHQRGDQLKDLAKGQQELLRLVDKILQNVGEDRRKKPSKE